MEITEQVLDDCAALLRVDSNKKGDALDQDMKVACRGFFYVSMRLKKPAMKRKWNTVACNSVGPFYDRVSPQMKTEIDKIRGLQKQLNIGQILEKYGVYSSNARQLIQQSIQDQKAVSDKFIASLFEFVYLEFFQPRVRKN